MEGELTFTRFDRMCEKYPDQSAIIYLGERFSYSRLKDLIDRFATSLAQLGIGKGDKVMLYISNSVQWVISFFAIQKMGAVVIPVPPIYTSFEIEYMINDSGAETVICLDTNFGYVKEIFSKTCLKRAIVTNLVDLLPLWKRTVGFLFDKIPRGTVDRDKNIYSFKDLLKNPPQRIDVQIDPMQRPRLYPLYRRDNGLPQGSAGQSHWYDVLCQ